MRVQCDKEASVRLQCAKEASVRVQYAKEASGALCTLASGLIVRVAGLLPLATDHQPSRSYRESLNVRVLS